MSAEGAVSVVPDVIAPASRFPFCARPNRCMVNHLELERNQVRVERNQVRAAPESATRFVPHQAFMRDR